MTTQHNRLAGLHAPRISSPDHIGHRVDVCAPELAWLFRAPEQERNYHQYVRAANKTSAHNPFFPAASGYCERAMESSACVRARPHQPI
jgi:hypothetical protein